MKIYHIGNVQKFSETIDSCKGQVFLISKTGDRYNLKSKLSQLVSLADLFGAEETFSEMEVVTERKEDAVTLLDYLMSA